MTVLQVALVGMGRVARVHLEALRSTSAVEVVGVFDTDQARAHEREGQFNLGQAKGWHECSPQAARVLTSRQNAEASSQPKQASPAKESRRPLIA